MDSFSNMEKVTKIILNPRVSDTAFTYTDFAEGETLDKSSLTLEDSFKSFMHKADPAIGTTLFYIPWNKDTYIHSVKDNKHHKLFHATSDKVEAKSINKDVAELDAIYSHENNNKMVEHDLYHGKNTYQITSKFHFDITNGALLHKNNDELKIYNRAGSVIETVEATSVEEKGFEPFVVKDEMNYLDVVYIPHGVNTMIVVLGKYLGEITLLNVIRFTPEGVVNIKSGQATCVNETPESATVVNNEEEGDGKYILKTQIVPPVCPTCPTCPSCCNSDKKDTCTSCGGNGGNGTKNEKGDSILKDADKIRDDVKKDKEVVEDNVKPTNVGGVVNNTVDAAGNVITSTVDAAGNVITSTVDTAGNLIEKTGAGIYDILTQNRNNVNTNMNTNLNSNLNIGMNTRNVDYKMNTGNTMNNGNMMTYDDYSRNGLIPPSGNNKYVARTADFSSFGK